MFQKSLQILVVTTLLLLAAIVGYATLRLHGPEDNLAEAETLIQNGELGRAIGLLSGTESSVLHDAKLRRQLWQQRLRANTQLGQAAGALLDIDNLLRDGSGDQIELRLDQIRLLAMAGRGDEARQAAQRFLLENPGHDRALELAGEACQTVYQPRLRSLITRLDRELGATERRTGRAALLSYLYRSDGDSEGARAAESLRRIYTAVPRRSPAWLPLWQEMQQLRARIQEGLGYFRDSLESGGEPVAAFRAVALALEQSQRIDDLLLACEIQRRRFDHAYVAEAGAAAAWALLREQQPAAALATADRWLPTDSIPQRAAQNRLGTATADLVLARAYAAWQLRDQLQLQRAATEGYQLDRAGQPSLANAFANAVQQNLNPDKFRQNLDNTLRWARGIALRPVPLGQLDTAPILVGLSRDLLRSRGGSAEEQRLLLESWVQARPDDIEPRLAMANLLLELGRTGAALAQLAEAAALDPNDERTFPLRLQASRSHFRDAGQDGPGLLLQCQTRRVLVPEVTDQIGYLLCAETAMEQKIWPVAVASARNAVDAFPNERLPRLLEIRACLADGRFQDAAERSLRLLQLLRPDHTTAQLALEAHVAAGLPTRPLLAAAMATGEPTPTLQVELLRHALGAGPVLATDFVTSIASGPTATDELGVLAALALSRAGRVEAATGFLDRLLPQAPELAPTLRPQLLDAYATWLPLIAPADRDETLATTIAQRLSRFGPLPAGGAALLTVAAERLAPTHPRSALVLLTNALEGADAEERTGTLYALAGRLAARAGDWAAATENWTAALAFADPRNAAEDLARLCFALGQDARAQKAFALSTSPTDPAMAMRCEQPLRALELTAVAIARDRADLLAHCLLAQAGQPALSDWTPLSGEAASERFELLALMHDPALAPLALPQLQRLREANPGSRTTRLLLARALAHAGQPAEASALHAQLHREGCADLVFWREVALAAEVPGYVADGALRQVIMDVGTSGGLANSPLTLSYALRSVADVFRDAGHRQLADQVELSMWLQVPGAKPMRESDLALVTGGHKPADAFYILDEVLSGPYGQGPERPARIDRLHELARAALAADPALLPVLRSNAEEYLQRDGARGEIVHFLLDHADLGPPPHLDAGAREALLSQHLDFVAAGGEHSARLGSTIDQLVQLRGLDPMLTRIEQLRQAWPTTLVLWLERARLSVGSPQGRAAVEDLRQALQHADSPAVSVAFTSLAANNRQVTAADLERFSRVPRDVHRSPAGLFAAAMTALRLGRADEALPLFAEAAPQPDGMHLYAQALALLQSRRPDAMTTARLRLQELVRDYPNSSLARNAGSFANQLVPR
jgi:TolA-binding protein